MSPSSGPCASFSERTWHMADRQRQILASASTEETLKRIKVTSFPFNLIFLKMLFSLRAGA